MRAPRWLVPAPPARLGLARAILGGYTLWYLGRRRGMLARISRTDAELSRPVGVARPLRRPLPPAAAGALTDATLAANVAFLLGWRHRLCGPAFSGLLLATLSYRNSWSMVYHSDNLLVLHALVLGVSPAADAVALDARRARRAGRAPPAPGVRYGWPLSLMNALTTLTYLVAGSRRSWARSGASG